MQQALRSAKIEPGKVDYINAHGTATIFNDAAEGKAIAEIFGNRAAVSSPKAMMGHSLGAAGAIEAIVCLLALQHEFLPANINFRSPDEDVDLDIIANEPRSACIATTLSNSFGFGGTNASVVMQKHPR
jgi:3-oxoacyl-(acyl-carrier-protein) synthase